ncbi:hypothetical protein ACIPYS_07660 [Kitasatospora sp. NPDC089913]|uniref:hypothetical protein n=1 Tax=Kitasatospora sp. NPDC089913 TaxID=3364080 RepID=UPI0037FFB534
MSVQVSAVRARRACRWLLVQVKRRPRGGGGGGSSLRVHGGNLLVCEVADGGVHRPLEDPNGADEAGDGAGEVGSAAVGDGGEDCGLRGGELLPGFGKSVGGCGGCGPDTRVVLGSGVAHRIRRAGRMGTASIWWVVSVLRGCRPGQWRPGER